MDAEQSWHGLVVVPGSDRRCALGVHVSTLAAIAVVFLVLIWWKLCDIERALRGEPKPRTFFRAELDPPKDEVRP